ncbi:MAG: DUF5658 family protein [Planctomycetota bacterium]
MTTTVNNNAGSAPSQLGAPFVLTGTAYTWIVVAASLDILLTGIILANGGQEINPIANLVLMSQGFTGMVMFKYIAVFFIILGCEFVTRHNMRKGQRLAIALIAIHFTPVFWSTSLILSHI